MLLPSSSLVALLLIKYAWSYTDEGGFRAAGAAEGGDLGYLYPDELPDDDGGELEARKRTGNNNFLRFGRGGGGGGGGGPASGPTYDEYDDYGEDYARPTRSGKVEKNDHFIRFGRGKQNYIRFGRDSHRVQRANHLRFGRSVAPAADRGRPKRDVASLQDAYKRADSNFLRFGRPNSNFMRFGRQPQTQPQLQSHLASVQSEADADYTERLHREAGELWQKLRRLPDAQFAAVAMQMLEGARRREAWAGAGAV